MTLLGTGLKNRARRRLTRRGEGAAVGVKKMAAVPANSVEKRNGLELVYVPDLLNKLPALPPEKNSP
jgi:hypothetical protein